jgi:hypothetical protein
MREPNKSAGMIQFGLLHAVVDQAAGGNIRVIQALQAGEDRSVNACLVHHTNMRRQIGE